MYTYTHEVLEGRVLLEIQLNRYTIVEDNIVYI